MNYIELFAGCGGLSLGLESIGFELVLANELSPMASETFAYNFFQENLSKQTPEILGERRSLKTKWLSSNFPSNCIQKRLREDPRSFLEYGQGFCDFSSINALKGNLIVANIVEVNQWLARQKTHLDAIKDGFGSGGVDLVSGGPPCQSFSMAGMREFSNSRNTLPWEFVKFVEQIQPKIVLLENVSGILRPFKVEGKSYYAWFEVAKAFAKINYIPLCLHINAKYIGIAQNRPRFILLAIRHDIFDKLSDNLNSYEQELFEASKIFHAAIMQKKTVKYGDLPYFDVSKKETVQYFNSSFLKPLIAVPLKHTSVQEAIDDLRHKGNQPSNYIENLNKLFRSSIKLSEIKNHEYRNNTKLVKCRFRIYQVLNKVSGATQNNVKALLKGKIDKLSSIAATEMLTHSYLNDHYQLIYFDDDIILENYLIQHRTKKQTQKSLDCDSTCACGFIHS